MEGSAAAASATSRYVPGATAEARASALSHAGLARLNRKPKTNARTKNAPRMTLTAPATTAPTRSRKRLAPE